MNGEVKAFPGMKQKVLWGNSDRREGIKLRYVLFVVQTQMECADFGEIDVVVNINFIRFGV